MGGDVLGNGAVNVCVIDRITDLAGAGMDGPPHARNRYEIDNERDRQPSVEVTKRGWNFHGFAGDTWVSQAA